MELRGELLLSVPSVKRHRFSNTFTFRVNARVSRSAYAPRSWQRRSRWEWAGSNTSSGTVDNNANLNYRQVDAK